MKNNNNFSKNQSEQFDLASDYYDRFRPSYPQEIINCIQVLKLIQKYLK